MLSSWTPVRAALAEALSLAFPTSCAGCDVSDASLCAVCRLALVPSIRSRCLDGVAVHSGLVFEGVPARVIRSLKEEGRTGLARALGPALAASIARAGTAPDVAIVPVPSSRAALRRRGYRPVELLIHRAGEVPVRALRGARRTADQRGLAREQRALNVAGSMVSRGLDGRSVLVVDDVVTTGATLVEAFRALRVAGADVIGAATVASTERIGATYRTRR